MKTLKLVCQMKQCFKLSKLIAMTIRVEEIAHVKTSRSCFVCNFHEPLRVFSFLCGDELIIKFQALRMYNHQSKVLQCWH